ncbi:MAG: TlpA disulfide reductase family protein [Acidobacteria bacterium]|nr:TlpA disulfide reductase family protein [Acidobacteriota bacterium]
MTESHGRVAASHLPPGLTVACLVCLLLAACSGSRSPCLPGMVALNRPAPEFAVEDRAGQVHRLSDFRGKVVLINFWATWCPPCIEEMPSMESLRKEIDESQLQIMALSVDDSWEPIDTFLEKSSYGFGIYADFREKIAKLYGTHMVPETYIVDKQGVILCKVTGDRDWTEPATIAFLKRLIAD